MRYHFCAELCLWLEAQHRSDMLVHTIAAHTLVKFHFWVAPYMYMCFRTPWQEKRLRLVWWTILSFVYIVSHVSVTWSWWKFPKPVFVLVAFVTLFQLIVLFCCKVAAVQDFGYLELGSVETQTFWRLKTTFIIRGLKLHLTDCKTT